MWAGGRHVAGGTSEWGGEGRGGMMGRLKVGRWGGWR